MNKYIQMMMIVTMTMKIFFDVGDGEKIFILYGMYMTLIC
jgi:hypothetical protein